MYRFILITIVFTFLNAEIVKADSGHDLLEKCEAAVESRNDKNLKNKLDAMHIREFKRVLDKEELKLLYELAINTCHLKAAQCISFLSGFGGADALSPLTRKGKRMFCVPKNISLDQAAHLTVEWMNKNTDKLDYGANEVLLMSNIVNFPCPRT